MMKVTVKLILMYVWLQCFLWQQAYSQAAFYPSPNQIRDSLVSLQQRFPRIAAVRNIGGTTHSDLEMIALEITRHVETRPDKPVWVFTGIIHGREQLGLRIILELAHELTEGYAHNPEIKKWVDAYDIWLVPSMNPWGYVHNKRKNGIATDDRTTAGVDLNRNFGFRWSRGGDTNPRKSSYRGVKPFSEKETRNMKALYLKLRPVFGLTFHQGNNPDGGQLMVPWKVKDGVSAPPDAAVLSYYANFYADRVFHSRQSGSLCRTGDDGNFVLEDPDGTPCGDVDSVTFCKELCWRPDVTGLSPIGQSSNYYYAAVGTIDFTMELSDHLFSKPFMHRPGPPANTYDSTLLDIVQEIKKNNLDAIKDWFDHFLYKKADGRYAYRGPGITGHVRDKQTNKPVQATIEVADYTSPLTERRKTDAAFGRFWRLLPAAGKYEVIIRAPGYAGQKITIEVKDGPLTNLEIGLSRIAENGH